MPIHTQHKDLAKSPSMILDIRNKARYRCSVGESVVCQSICHQYCLSASVAAWGAGPRRQKFPCIISWFASSSRVRRSAFSPFMGAVGDSLSHSRGDLFSFVVYILLVLAAPCIHTLSTEDYFCCCRLIDDWRRHSSVLSY